MILTDLMMPDMSGEQLVRAVRSHPALDATPIVVLSAKADDDQRIRLLRDGVQDFLVKPFAVEELLARVGNLAAKKAAIEEVRGLAQQLEARVAQRTEQLRRLASELEAAANRERREIARELHDDLGQTLAAARIRLAALCDHADAGVREAATQIAELIDDANRSTRSLAAQLAPAVLYELGLVAALEWLGEEVERTFGLRVAVSDDGAPKPMSSASRSVVYRAARELLINAAKHARTDRSEVHVERSGDQVVVRVADAGVGFDPSLITMVPGQGLGLVSVRERLAFIGGAADIRSIPGDGTMATLTAPLAPDEAPESEFGS